MEKKTNSLIIILITLIGILGIAFVLAIQISNFDGYGIAENLTFTGDENITRNMTIPKYSNVTSAFMNLSGYIHNPNNIFLDIEDSWDNNSCVNNPENAFDENWTSFSTTPGFVACGSVYGNIYENYTIPDYVIENVNFTIKIYDNYAGNNMWFYCHNYSSGTDTQFWFNDGTTYPIQNLTFSLPSVCFSGDILRMRFRFTSNNDDQVRIYESSVLWFNESYLNNSYIQINNTQIWNFSGEFNSTFSPNKTDDFSSVLNTALNSGVCDCSGCFLSGDNCTIPFLFHSDTAGILEYSNLNIQYTPPPSSHIKLSNSRFQLNDGHFRIT